MLNIGFLDCTKVELWVLIVCIATEKLAMCVTREGFL